MTYLESMWCCFRITTSMHHSLGQVDPSTDGCRDHFDKFVEDSLRRDLPIITTKHAQQCLQSKGPQDSFTNVHAVDAFENLLLNLSNGSGRTDKKPAIKVAGMPGKHVPPGPIAAMDDILKIVNKRFCFVGETDTDRFLQQTGGWSNWGTRLEPESFRTATGGASAECRTIPR